MEEDHKHKKMIHSSGHPMELDIYIEDLKLAFEYQGEQHYRPKYNMGGNFEAQKTRDQEKKEACEQVLLIGNTDSVVNVNLLIQHLLVL